MSKMINDRTKRSGKAKRPAVPNDAPDTPTSKPRLWLRCFTWLLVIGCLVGAYVATSVLAEHFLFPRIPSDLVGRWHAKDGKQDLTLELARNGAFTVRAKVAGKEVVVHGRAELNDADEKVLYLISMNSQKKSEVTKAHIIRVLTQKELVMEDPTGMVSKFVRVE